MELLKATLMVLTAVHVAPGLEGLKVDVTSHLQHLATHRYPNKEQKEARKQAAEYISRHFEECGLRVDLQSLCAFAAPHPGSHLTYDTHSQNKCNVNGMNIIGVSGPERDEAGAVVVVGAAYDTDGLGNPLHNNGAGVAVLLETARLYQATAPQPRLATLFVAFDLSVERYGRKTSGGGGGDGGGGGGLSGGYSLVQDYLRSFVRQNTSRVGGAIVLGPLMNVNHEKGSQRFDSRLKEMFPDAHQEIAAGGYRGDFLAMVTRGGEEGEAQHTLAQQVAHSYSKVGGKLLKLSLGNHSHTLLPPSLPTRQAAFFWDSTYEGLETPLPAILLTDTEINRDWPPDATPHTNLTASQKAFLDNTVTSLVHFLVQRQSVADWWEAGLLAALLASCTVNLLLIVHLHHLCISFPADKKQDADKVQDDDDFTSETLALENMHWAASDGSLVRIWS